MPSDKQGTLQTKNQAQQNEPPEAKNTTQPAAGNNTTTSTQTAPPHDTGTMPNYSTTTPMTHPTLTLQTRSQYQESQAARRSRNTPQAGSADLFAVGAWADSHLGPADIDFDEHLGSSSQQGPSRK